jgi:hypothetical protein
MKIPHTVPPFRLNKKTRPPSKATRLSQHEACGACPYETRGFPSLSRDRFGFVLVYCFDGDKNGSPIEQARIMPVCLKSLSTVFQYVMRLKSD